MPTLLPPPQEPKRRRARPWAWVSGQAARRWGLDRRGAAGTLAALLVALLLAGVWGLLERPGAPPTHLKASADSALGAARHSALQGGDRPASSTSPLPNPDRHGPGALAWRPHALRPETTSVAGWQALGLPEGLSRRIAAYGRAGGPIHTPAGMQRVYGLVESGWWGRLSPYLIFDESKPRPRYPQDKSTGPPERAGAMGTYTRPAAPLVLDINTADSAALEGLPGIGPATAHRLIAYRRLLGGFVSLDQLYELYGQDSARTRDFSRYLRVGPGYRPAPLDWARYGQDYRYYHPYLPRAHARALRAWARERTTPPPGVAPADLPPPRPVELIALGLLDSAGLARLRPYLP